MIDDCETEPAKNTLSRSPGHLSLNMKDINNNKNVPSGLENTKLASPQSPVVATCKTPPCISPHVAKILKEEAQRAASAAESEELDDGMSGTSTQESTVPATRRRVPRIRWTNSNLRYIKRILENLWNDLMYFRDVHRHLKMTNSLHPKFKMTNDVQLAFYELRNLSDSIIKRFYDTPTDDTPLDSERYVQLWPFIATTVELSMFPVNVASKPTGGTRRQNIAYNKLFSGTSPKEVKATLKIEGLNNQESAEYALEITKKLVKLEQSPELKRLIDHLEPYMKNIEKETADTVQDPLKKYIWHILKELSKIDPQSTKLSSRPGGQLAIRRLDIFWSSFGERMLKITTNLKGLKKQLGERLEVYDVIIKPPVDHRSSSEQSNSD